MAVRDVGEDWYQLLSADYGIFYVQQQDNHTQILKVDAMDLCVSDSDICSISFLWT